MKQVVSVSLGSSTRNKTCKAELAGEEFSVSRIGVDGDMKAFAGKLEELDGRADALGLGGIDLYLCIDGRRYTIRDAARLASVVKETPVVDGSGVKNTLERRTVEYLQSNGIVDFGSVNVMMVCSLDRFGMAEAIRQYSRPGCFLFGDVMFALGLNVPIYSYGAIKAVAKTLLPVYTRLPFSMLYPTGKSQTEIVPRYEDKSDWADVIAGDYLFIKKHRPPAVSGALQNKVILTNTLTEEDAKDLEERGVRLIISSTPQLCGRNFGTNVLEGIITVLLGKSIYSAAEEELTGVLDRLGWKPSIVYNRNDKG
ncbi:MAG: quinate 5-dehydrogenase [Abditibacteriota bacterium]|nr:quinate 5-dehydrogenase [Abditibacteriota bacterium]